MSALWTTFRDFSYRCAPFTVAAVLLLISPFDVCG
jgi:hypothetical protein